MGSLEIGESRRTWRAKRSGLSIVAEVMDQMWSRMVVEKVVMLGYGVVIS